MNKVGLLFAILSLLLTNSLDALCQDTLSNRNGFVKNAEFFSKGIASKYNERYDEAIDYFEKALEAFPEDHASMYELSSLYNENSLQEKGFEMIKKAVELDSTNKWYKIRLADFYRRNNDYHSFIDIYDNLLKDEPNNLEYLEAYIDALLHIGDLEKVTEKLDVLKTMSELMNICRYRRWRFTIY